MENKRDPQLNNTHACSENTRTTKEKQSKTVSVDMPLEKGVISRLIRALREIRSYSQTRLGRILGVQKSQISKLEKGDNNITLNTLIKIFSALKINVGFKVEVASEEEAIKLRKIAEEKDDNLKVLKA